MRNRYWEEKYKEMIEEVGNTPAEKKVLEMLAGGWNTIECQKESGLSLQEFFKLMERTEVWEIENLCSDE